MEQSAQSASARTRLLGLGNEILADDAFGILVAREFKRLFPRQIEVVCSAAAGFNLLDDLLGARRVVVVDTIMTGAAKPGTIHVFQADPVSQQAGIAPHFLGLFEVLAFARRLHLDVAEDAIIIAVEASDCTTIGGAMHPDVRAAIAGAVDLVKRCAAEGRGENGKG
jgi:hydrogenase maturation protease